MQWTVHFETLAIYTYGIKFCLKKVLDGLFKIGFHRLNVLWQQTTAWQKSCLLWLSSVINRIVFWTSLYFISCYKVNVMQYNAEIIIIAQIIIIKYTILNAAGKLLIIPEWFPLGKCNHFPVFTRPCWFTVKGCNVESLFGLHCLSCLYWLWYEVQFEKAWSLDLLPNLALSDQVL